MVERFLERDIPFFFLALILFTKEFFTLPFFLPEFFFFREVLLLVDINFKWQEQRICLQYFV